MAVEIKYVVVRGGVEKMTFASKKEADAYDKLLDTADELMTLLAGAPIELAPEQQESLAFYLAEQRDVLQTLLRGGKVSGRHERGRGSSSQAQGEATQTGGLMAQTLFLGINGSTHSLYLHLKPFSRLFTPRIF